MSFTQAVVRLGARDIVDVLGALAEHLATGDKSTALPVLTVIIDGGVAMRGEMLAFKADRTLHTLVLQSNRGPASVDVSYIPTGMIRALTVHASRENLHLLGGGRVNPLFSGKGPGRLETDRQFAEWNAVVKESCGVAIEHEIEWSRLPDGDQARHMLARLIRDVQGVLLEIMADAMGRDAVQAKVRRLKFSPGERPAVTLDQGVATISFRNMGDDIEVWDSPSIKDALEKLL